MKYTEEQFKQLENKLIEYGYTKFMTCLYGNESYGWFKSFRNENDDTEYQIEFAIYDYTKFPYDDDDPFAVQINILLGGTEYRIDLCITSPYFSIDDIESLAKETYNIIEKKINKIK